MDSCHSYHKYAQRLALLLTPDIQLIAKLVCSPGSLFESSGCEFTCLLKVFTMNALVFDLSKVQQLFAYHDIEFQRLLYQQFARFIVSFDFIAQLVNASLDTAMA